MAADAINLAADYGWGPYALLWIFLIVVAFTTAGFIIVMYSSRIKKKQTFALKTKYHPERYWAIGVAGVLVWLWIISYPWMPPVAFSKAVINDSNNKDLQVVNITAGQWFWLMRKIGDEQIKPGEVPYVTLIAGEPVKFVAHSIDVNHGFGVFDSPKDGAPILLQMQIIPGLDNVFYYTFKHPGNYLVRCLEYCGSAHPYMTSQITVVSSGTSSLNDASLLLGSNETSK
jgi:cytochrome c oxidase subunit 2